MMKTTINTCVQSLLMKHCHTVRQYTEQFTFYVVQPSAFWYKEYNIAMLAMTVGKCTWNDRETHFWGGVTIHKSIIPR